MTESKFSLLDIKLEDGKPVADEDKEEMPYLDIRMKVQEHLATTGLRPYQLSSILELTPTELVDESYYLVSLINDLIIHGPNTAEVPTPDTLKFGMAWDTTNLTFKIHVNRFLRNYSLHFSQLMEFRKLKKPDLTKVVLDLYAFVNKMVDTDGIPGLGVAPVPHELL